APAGGTHCGAGGAPGGGGGGATGEQTGTSDWVGSSVMAMCRPAQLTTCFDPSTVVLSAGLGGTISTLSLVAASTPSSRGFSPLGSISLPELCCTRWPPMVSPLSVQLPELLTTLSEVALMSPSERTWSTRIWPPPMSMLLIVEYPVECRVPSVSGLTNECDSL